MHGTGPVASCLIKFSALLPASLKVLSFTEETDEHSIGKPFLQGGIS